MKKLRLSKIILHCFLILGSLGMIMPFSWMIMSSLKSNSEIFSTPPTFLPTNPNFKNIIDAWQTADFNIYFINTFIIAIVTTVITLIICSVAGYAFAKYNFFGKGILFTLFLGTMMVPIQVTMIPIFLMLSKLGILNTYWAVILPLCANAYGVFLMKQFIETLPDELLESARIDGLSEVGIFTKIILPLIKPALTTLGILTFLAAWNEFLLPLIMLDSSDMMTLQIGLTQFQGQYNVQWNLLMAASVISIIPILIIFLIFQRFLVEGVAMTGLKN